MKMKRTSKGGGVGVGGNNQNRNHAKKRKMNRPSPRPPPPSSVGSVATRTRGKTKVQAATTWDQPVPIIIHIVSFLDQTGLRKVSTVCKQLHKICNGEIPGTTNIVIPVLELSASLENPDFGRTDRVLQQLDQQCTKLQRYRKMTITDGHKFRCRSSTVWDDLRKYKFQLNGVVSLHCFSVSTTEYISDSSLPFMLARILPNLREVDLSTTGCYYHVLDHISTTCARLEKVTWNNIDRSSAISVDGAEMNSATNLKEIYMDGAQFYDLFNDSDHDTYDFEDDDHPDIFLFHRCRSKVLERISIRNARDGSITQNMLIKFIRKAPTSLRWFRSDLTPANMAMLRLERPGIEFV